MFEIHMEVKDSNKHDNECFQSSVIIRHECRHVLRVVFFNVCLGGDFYFLVLIQFTAMGLLFSPVTKRFCSCRVPSPMC